MRVYSDKVNICAECGAKFTAKQGKVKYCIACGIKVHNETAHKYYIEHKQKISERRKAVRRENPKGLKKKNAIQISREKNLNSRCKPPLELKNSPPSECVTRKATAKELAKYFDGVHEMNAEERRFAQRVIYKGEFLGAFKITNGGVL